MPFQLGEAFGINRATVSAILKREGISTRWKALTDVQVDEAIKLYQAGLSLAAVGDHFSVKAGAIRNALNHCRVSRRAVGTNQWT